MRVELFPLFNVFRILGIFPLLLLYLCNLFQKHIKNMRNQVLSIEQMQTLKNLGVDTSKASIYWIKQVNGIDIADHMDGEPFLGLHNGEQLMCAGFMRFETIPTFTLYDIIQMLPDSIEINGVTCYLGFNKDFIEYISDFEDQSFILFGDNMLENMYKILIWLLENKYI